MPKNERVNYEYVGVAFLKPDEGSTGIPLFRRSMSNSVYSIQAEDTFTIKQFQFVNVDHFYCLNDLPSNCKAYCTGDLFPYLPILWSNAIFLIDLTDDASIRRAKELFRSVDSVLLSIARLRKEGLKSVVEHSEGIGMQLEFKSEETAEFRSSEVLIYQSPLDLGSSPLESDPARVDDHYIEYLRELPRDDLLKILLKPAVGNLLAWGYVFEIFIARFSFDKDAADIIKAAIEYMSIVVNGNYKFDRLDRLIFRETVRLYSERSEDFSVDKSIEDDLIDLIDLLEGDDLLPSISDGDPAVALQALHLMAIRKPDSVMIDNCLALLASRGIVEVNQENEGVRIWSKSIKDYMIEIVKRVDLLDELRYINSLMDLLQILTPSFS